MEITQFTYFQQMAGLECKPVSVELTYGLERICMFTQEKKNVFDLLWNNEGVKYKDVFYQAEKEFSAYNFEFANTDTLLKSFENIELLANDSLYIFIETTIDINDIDTDQTSFLYDDKIEFLNSNNTQEVNLISLVKDAVFIYPSRYENNQQFIYETLEIDFDGDGINEETEIRGRYLNDEELTFTNEKAYVIYGYAAEGSLNPFGKVSFFIHSTFVSFFSFSSDELLIPINL